MASTSRLAVLAAVLVAASTAEALTLLTAEKVATFSNEVGHQPGVVIRVGRDRAFATPPDPRCPAATSVRFALARPPAGFEDHGEVALDCTRWRPDRGGYRYDAPPAAPGGVRTIRYDPHGMVIRAGGAGFVPVAGPVAYVEAWLTIAGERHLVRFQNFVENDAQHVRSRRPSRAAAAGEAAFWDTLWDDVPREQDALRLLERAVRHRATDGRSQFLLGMLHLYRAARNIDFENPTPFTLAENAAGKDHLAIAAQLLATDTRIAGFHAAATYADAYLHDDAAGVAAALQTLDDEVAIYPIFNSFDLFAVVPPTISGKSEFFQTRVLPLEDLVLIDNASCLETHPEVCTNAGMAPHNLEGTLLLLGDIYAKGGRLASARSWYGLARVFGTGNHYRYQATIVDHLAHAAERVALSQDDDPQNDPPLIGNGAGSCIYCHNK